MIIFCIYPIHDITNHIPQTLSGVTITSHEAYNVEIYCKSEYID